MTISSPWFSAIIWPPTDSEASASLMVKRRKVTGWVHWPFGPPGSKPASAQARVT